MVETRASKFSGHSNTNLLLRSHQTLKPASTADSHDWGVKNWFELPISSQNLKLILLFFVSIYKNLEHVMQYTLQKFECMEVIWELKEAQYYCDRIMIQKLIGQIVVEPGHSDNS